MNNMSDEELDKLFRKSAESYEPPYDPAAWEAMERKLDAPETGKPWWNRLLYPLLILLLIGTSVAIVRLAQEPRSAGQPVSGKQEVNRFPKEDKVGASGDEKGVSGSMSQPIRKSAEIDRSDIVYKGPQKHTKYLASVIETKQVQEVPLLALREAKLAFPTAPAAVEGTGIGIAPPQPEAVLTLSQAKDTTDQYADTREKSVFLSRLELALVVAPDVTSVKFRNAERISANAGLLAAIPLTPRFSIVTGVIWAKKVYGATPEIYAPTADYWDGKKLPSTIDAACRVLDIPLNIRYRLLEREMDALSIQAGLSSYIMLREEYTYNYTYSAHPYSKETTYSNQNQHWFGVQNLSVNYSRKLSPDFSVGVEPFIKLPLSGIGAGNVRLSSAGLFLTAGYTLPLKK